MKDRLLHAPVWVKSFSSAYIRKRPHDALSKSSLTWTPKVFPLSDAVAAYLALKSALSYARNYRPPCNDLQNPLLAKNLDAAKVSKNPKISKKRGINI